MVLIAAAVALAAYCYANERPELTRRQRLLPAAMRALALSLLVLLIARPTLIAEGQGQRPRGVAILFDNSASMKQSDRRTSPLDIQRVAIAQGKDANRANEAAEDESAAATVAGDAARITRIEVVQAAWTHALGQAVSELRQAGPIKAYLFGARAKRADLRGVDQAVTGSEERSAIWDAVRETAAAVDGDAPGAIILVTDGVDNGSAAGLEDVIAELRALDVAIHVYGVGSVDSGALRLLDAVAPESMFADDAAAITVRWRYRGAANGTAVVVVNLNGQEVARKELPAQPGDHSDIVTFTPEIKPGGPATAEIAISIRMKDDALPVEELHKQVALSERKLRVLVVDDAPRWEFKFIQPALSRDRRVKATYYVAQGDPRALGNQPFIRSFPSREQLFGYDLVVLGDVAPAALGPEGMTALVDFVSEGGGLAAIAGRKHMPADYADTPLAEVLPVEFVPVRFPAMADERTSPYQPELTAAGRRSPLLMLADTSPDNDRAWNELPGLYWHYPVTKLRPGATALLQHPRKLADEATQPLIASQYYGKGPVLFLGVDETWRWRYNSGDKIYARFWGQVVYQFGMPHLLGHSSRVQLSLDRADAIVGRPGNVYARIFDTEYRPYLADKVPAILEPLTPAGAPRPMTLDPVPGRPGEYRTVLPHDAPGRFELRVQQPETGTLDYQVVLPPGHELEPAGLNEPMLRQLAEQTGGQFFREETLNNLAQQVIQKQAKFTVRQEVLFGGPAVWFVIVGLVTGEWICRKLANLC